MELQSVRFSTSIPHFKGFVLFLDDFGLLRVLNPLNPTCEVINWRFITEHLYQSKLFIPSNNISKTFASKLILKTHMDHNCCGITFLIQTINESYFIHDPTRLCKHVLSSCFKCLRDRLIDKKKFVQSEKFTFPKDYILNLDIDKISYQINSVWQIDLIPRLNMINSTYNFVDKSALKKYEGLAESRIYYNILIFVNSRTSYVHFELLYTRRFEDLKIVLEMFLHKYSLYDITFISDKELSFQKLSRLNKNMKDVSFYNSYYAKTLQEKYNVRFSLHDSYHAQFYGRVEKIVGVVKRSFTSFKHANLNFHHMSCLLSSISRTLNDRPISLFRGQTLNSPLNIVTHRSLMFCCSKPINQFYLMRTQFDAKVGDNSYVIKLLKAHSTKILNLFTKYLLES